MENADEKMIHPLAIFKEAFLLWRHKALVLAGVNLIPAILLRLLTVWQEAGGGNVLSYAASFLISILLASYTSLVMAIFLRATTNGRHSFSGALADSRKRVAPFFKAFLLSTLLIGAIFFIAVIFYGAALGAKTRGLVFLLAVSACSVIFFIAACWYGFYASIALLIAAFEGRGPWQAICESKARIRGSALRYLASLLEYAGVYLGLGLVILGVLRIWTHEQRILGLIDPVLAVTLGPLGLAVWLTAYQRLTEIKGDVKSEIRISKSETNSKS